MMESFPDFNSRRSRLPTAIFLLTVCMSEGINDTLITESSRLRDSKSDRFLVDTATSLGSVIY